MKLNDLLSTLFALVSFGPLIQAQSENWPSETLRSNLVGAWTRSADFDQDGDPDFLLQAGDSVFWYENLRPGWAGHLIDATFINSIYGYVDVVDLDKDGDMDVLKVSGSGGGMDELSWNENVAKGSSWVKHHIFNPPSIALWLQNAWGDLDGDGDLDIAVAETDFNDTVHIGQLYWLEQTGDSTGWTKHALTGGDHWFTSVADMDGDGDPDIVSASAGIFWLENQLPSLAWTPHLVVSAASSEYFIGTCADLNGDNKADVIAGPSASHGAVSFFANPGWGETTMHPDPLFYYTGPAGDVDSDGDTDFLYGGNGFSPQSLGWLENENNGANWVVHDVTPYLILQQIPTGMADIDGDGDTDIVSLTFDVNTGLGSARWFANPKISTGAPDLKITGEFPLIQIAPNPVTDLLYVRVDAASSEQFILELFDLSGKLILHTTAADGVLTTLEMGELPGGMYHLRIRNGSWVGVRMVVRE